MFEKIYEELLSFINKNEDAQMSKVSEYLDEMCRYTIFDGKQNRAKAVVNSYKLLSKSNSNPEDLKLAHVIGCCIEIMQAGLLIHDDIMDSGETRRNKRCWHRLNNDRGYGLLSINDGLYLQTIIPKILRKYFDSKPCYMKLVELFNETLYKTCMGQFLDMMTSSSTIDWVNFTQDRYESIIRFKTAYYSFYLPVTSAMILTGESDELQFKQAEKILVKIGEYFQIQDDYLDCYGDSKVIGKVGLDIEEGKCTWLIVQALKTASEDQISQLKENYGHKESSKAQIVKNIYLDLNIESLYKQYEHNTYRQIVQMIKDVSQGDGKPLPEEIFIDFLNQIYKRTK